MAGWSTLGRRNDDAVALPFWIAGAGLLVVTAASWVFVIASSGDDEMEMVPGATAYLGSWTVMMAAMMLPSALPMVLAFVRLNLQQGETGRARAFVAAYLLVWAGFGGAATALHWVLQRLGWVDPMIASTSLALNAGLLLLAGAWQFSPLKQVCLAQCRTPLGFLVAEWRPRVAGAFAMGLRHGLLCTGCCWALMLLLFVGGVMNIAWIAALSLAVAIEKLAPRGELLGKLLGMALVAAALLRMAAIVRGG